MKLPSYVKEVPTIVVFDDYGRKEIHKGAQAFGWLNQFFQQSNKVEIISYEEGVMGSSLSDGFSFINAEEEPEHTFAYMDRLQDTRINTSEDDPTIGGGSVRGGELERYKSQRDQALPQIKKPSNVDFSKGFQKETPHKISERDVERFKNIRKQPRAPVPRRAPNFQSSNFQPGLTAQSRRTGISQPDLHSRMSEKERVTQSRMDKLRQEREKQDSMFGPRKPPPNIDFSNHGRSLRHNNFRTL